MSKGAAGVLLQCLSAVGQAARLIHPQHLLSWCLPASGCHHSPAKHHAAHFGFVGEATQRQRASKVATGENTELLASNDKVLQKSSATKQQSIMKPLHAGYYPC